jgi:hypothetical protein
MMITGRLQSFVAATLCGSAVAAFPAVAEPAPPSLRAVVTHVLPAPRLATVFELKLQLPQGRGLARMLLDAGVAGDDAAQAARLAAGHLGDGTGGCVAKVEISRPLDAAGLRVERIVLSAADGQTTIERRGDRLALTTAAAHAAPGATLI